MADELHLTGLAYYRDSVGAESFMQCLDDTIDVATKKTTRLQQSIGTAEEAIQLGEVSLTGAIVMLKNLDPTNYIEIKIGTGGTIIGKLTPTRRFLILPVGSGITAPFAIANVAACVMDIFIISL